MTLADRIVAFFDGFSKQYAKLAGTRKIAYPDYVALGLTDEEQFVQPDFVPRFLSQFLNFEEQDYTPEKGVRGSTPDFVPTDSFADSYVFEAKGCDWTERAAKAYIPTIKRYAQAHNVKYVVVLTPRQIDVYDHSGAKQLNLSVDLLSLYESETGRRMISVREELRHLQLFIETFSHAALTPDKKLTLLRAAPKWDGSEHLRLEDLIRNIRAIVELMEDELDRVLDARLVHLPKHVAGAVNKELHSLSLQILQLGDTYDINDIIGATLGSDQGRVRAALVARIAYLTATRLLVLRAWEDARYIPSTLIDGGLDEALKDAKNAVSVVFDLALTRGRRAYRWLFEMDGPYSWFIPSDDVLSEALYKLAPFNMSQVTSDVLGHVYESLIDISDRKNKGQYYTRRDVIKFIIDLTGFVPSGSRTALDMACGSGGFLVDLTRRYREKNISFAATMASLVGVEISDFPQFVAQANLLLQSASFIKRRAAKQFPAVLPIVEADALALFTNQNALNAIPMHNSAYVKSIARRRFNLVATNPPYIGQQGHSELFQRTMALSPALRNYSESKMDYLYYFICVGLDLLEDQGHLAFITTSYWLMNDGASKLRKKILDDACVECFIDFGETKLFPDAPGQHNAVFVLRRERDSKARAANVPYVVVVTEPIPEPNISVTLDEIRRAVRSGADVQGAYFRARPSVLRQSDLSDAPWRLFQEVKSRRAGLTERILGGNNGLCDISQGVVPGVQTIGANLTEIPQATVKKFALTPGSGVFVLTASEIRPLGKLNAREKSLLKPFYKNSDVSSLTMDGMANDLWLLYIDRDETEAAIPHYIQYLDRFRRYLEKRREVQRGTMKWFGLHWPRTISVFESKKLVWAYRSGETRFAISSGKCYGSTDMYFLQPRSTDVSVEFLFLYLNSEKVRNFLQNNGKKKGSANEVFSSSIKPLTVPVEWQDDSAVRKLMQRVTQALLTKRAETILQEALQSFDEVVAAKFRYYEPTLERST